MSTDQASTNGGQIARDRVADALRKRIRTGELRPGESLPTQKSLMKEFAVERNVVRQALAQLKRENLLADVGRGSPPTVAEPRPHELDEPRVAGVGLAERLEAAFQATDVTLDVYSLTTETLYQALSPVVMAITAGRPAPRSITTRIIVPSPDAKLGLPQLVGDPEDPRPVKRLHDLIQLHGRMLLHALRNLHERGYVRQVSAEIRGVPMTPVNKLYLLNGTEALTGYYEIVESDVEYEPEQWLHIFDVRGTDTKLFRCSSGADARDRHDVAYVEQTGLWFDSLWANIARPIEWT